MAYVKCIRNLISSTVPDGKTVTPTDDISIWLACGGRSETYTTLSQVLADSTCLSALINDNNAVDYLVRSTTWASDVCGDSSAMSYIGLNNYASNTLLADSTWRNAICNSTYFESVLNVKVPVMTSNTTPSGECFGDSKYGTFDYFQAFDGNSDTRWIANVSKGNACYIGYTFPSNAKFVSGVVNFLALTSTIKYQVYINGSWEDISTQETNVLTNHSTLFNSVANTDKLRLYISTQIGSTSIGYAGQVTDLQFYGRADI